MKSWTICRYIMGTIHGGLWWDYMRTVTGDSWFIWAYEILSDALEGGDL